jgi:hypothetical protein
MFNFFMSKTFDGLIRNNRQAIAEFDTQREVVIPCAAFGAWRHMKPKAKAIRNCGNATFMRITVMDIFLAFILVGAAAWLFVRRFEHRLETQHGPWIADVERSSHTAVRARFARSA